MLDRSTLSERIAHNMNAARFPKEEVTSITVPTAQVSNTEYNNVMKIIADTSTRLYGGTTYEYADVKADADQTKINHRIFTDGYVLSGSEDTTLLAFEVSEGDKFKLTGLMNDSTNDSLCWAVYSEVITLATDDTTAASLEGAFLDGSDDHLPGQTDVSETLIMPSGAAMLVVSIPLSDDTSTIEKYTAVEVEGIDTEVEDHEERITAVQSTVTSLLISMTAAENDIDDLQADVEDHESRLADAEDTVAALDAVVNGGDYETYESIKDEGTTYPNWRIYGDDDDGGGYVLSGDSACSVMAFSISAGDVIKLTGLKNSEDNPSLCWAIYNEYITPATDSTTTAALTAAMISRDSSNAEGRSDVSATLTMPSNAAMLLVSIPATDDESTIEEYVVSSESGLVPQVAQHTTQIEALQEETEDLDTIRTDIDDLEDTATSHAESISLLQDCVSTNVKSLLSTTLNDYGVINGGRITNDGIIVRDGNDVCTTYIIRLSAFTDLRFSASGLANNDSNSSLCWATFNISEDDVDFDELFYSPYQLDWSQYLMAAYSDTDDTTGRTGQSVELLDLNDTDATFLVFSTLAASADSCSVRNYNSSLLTELQESAAKASELITLKNALGYPSAWNARTSATTDNVTATMTLGDSYANIVIAATAATSGQHGMWLGFEAHNVVEGHKYILMLRYRGISGTWGASYYNSAIEWSGDGYVRNILTDESDYNVWKFDVGSQYFTAPSSGDLWIDFIVYTSETTTDAATVAEFDILPMLIDVTDTDLTCDALAALIEKSGVFYDSLMVSNYAIHPLKSINKEVLVTLGDSTTGMMCWQPQLARMKGWDWDQRQIEGLTFDGVGYPYTAMGIGGTCVEPLIYGDGTSDTGCSQYIRARYIKYYEPTIILVMCSYNGAHAGDHWGDNESMPVQPDDYGLADLIASGMNYDTGTYEDTYFGEEVDLVSDPTLDAPSFAASYFGMIWRIITDNPTARVVLITLMSDFMGEEYEVFTLKNEVIKHAAEVFHLPLVDAEHAGLNKVNRLTTRYDSGGVHFNEAGGLLLAKHIAANC